MTADPAFSPRQVQLRWQSVIEGRFQATDFVQFLGAAHRDFPSGTFWRELGRIMMEESATPPRRPLPIVLESIEDWRTTTRIDGILPLKIPLAADLAVVASTLVTDMGAMGHDLPERDARERVEEDIALCLLGWMHRRELRSTYGMTIELNTQCPRSATGAKEEFCVMAELPNGSRTVIFFTTMRAAHWTSIPEASIGHFDLLEARRDGEGALRLYGLDRDPDDFEM